MSLERHSSQLLEWDVREFLQLPAYNCRECNGLVDPTESVSCPHCNTKKPLLCSKCSSPINHHDIHEIEKLRVKKPLLCSSCGVDNQVVKCGLCNVGLVRSQGHTVSPLEGAKVYHKKCLDKRSETVTMANKAAPAAAGAGLLLALVFLLMGNSGLGVGALVLGLVLFVGIKMVSKIIEPR